MRFWNLPVVGLGLATLATGCGQTLEKDQPNFLSLKREYQTIRSYSCEGTVESEKKREVVEPAAWVRIKPTKANPTMVGFSSFKVLNTNDSTGMNQDLFSFYVHTSDTVLGYQVTPGKNQVKYNFWGCRSWAKNRDRNGRPICVTKGTLLESGIVEINVAFEESLRSEVTDVRPDVSLCEARALHTTSSASHTSRNSASSVEVPSGTR